MGASASVSEAVAVTNDCLGIGGLVFDKVKDKLLIFAGVGNLVTHLNDIYKDDAVMQGLRELESKINQLTNKMQWQFTDLKAFIVENNFYTEIAETANTLMKYQNDVLKNPNEHSIGLFRQAAERTPPLHYAYLLLEAFVNGMFWDSNMYGPNELRDKIDGIYGRIDWLRGNYKRTYWPGAVENIIHDVQDNGNIKGNDAKALEIKKHLMSILNDHIFYIIVYDHCGTYENHAFQGNEDQYMVSFRRGGCNVVVYRSYHFLHCDGNAIDRIKDQVESCRHGVIRTRGSLESIPGMIRDKHVSYTGFVGLIKKEHNVVIRSANSYKAEWGPGWWITAKGDVYGASTPQLDLKTVSPFLLLSLQRTFRPRSVATRNSPLSENATEVISAACSMTLICSRAPSPLKLYT
ncbi:hypothetical protein GCK72_020570 [Caenorhabditis remanei]|uniref:Uncharacterized protein n=1 Tax=Caenorhabditis remanei TaxID=31234 RepID=A0A6A5GHM1_CAERE|nr:hypothetical protein GCK72_020570 [Caenorhabditis remanei]KAF1754012.1 hypothetical protein GCK72_020570 [Caenorhabditis remanei]